MTDMVRRRSWPFRVAEQSLAASGELGGQSGTRSASTTNPALSDAGQLCERRHDPHSLDASSELRHNAVTTPP